MPSDLHYLSLDEVARRLKSAQAHVRRTDRVDARSHRPDRSQAQELRDLDRRPGAWPMPRASMPRPLRARRAGRCMACRSP